MEKEKETKETEKEPEAAPAEAAAPPVVHETIRPDKLEELILNSPLNKYDTVLFSRRWAYELKGKEHETRAIAELIPQALHDVLSLRVDSKLIQELPALKTLKKQKLTAASLLENVGKSAVDTDEEPAKKEGKEKPSKKKS